MATTKDSVTAPPSSRLQRGIRLFRERGHEIELLEAHTYAVPVPHRGVDAPLLLPAH